MKIIGADERLGEQRGAKIVIVGPPGVGKTTLLRTLDISIPTTLLVDSDAGDLAVQDLRIDAIRVDDWPTARDLACRIGGPNPSFPANACYSSAHYEDCGGALENLERYTTIFVDSFSAISRLSFRHAEQQPEAFTSRGAKDLRSAYGLHARELLMWFHQLQHVREKTSSSLAFWSASSTTSIAANGSSRWRAQKRHANCRASSTKSSRCNGLISVMASRCVPLSARNRTHGVTRQRIAVVGSSKSRSRILAS